MPAFIGSLRDAIGRGDDLIIATVNLAGVTPAGTVIEIPDGMPLEAEIFDLSIKETEEVQMVPDGNGGTMRARSWMWTMKVQDADYIGAQRTYTGRVPDLSDKGRKAEKNLRAIAESVGFTPAKLDAAGMLQFVGTLFFEKPEAGKPPKGKKCYLLNKHRGVTLADGTRAKTYDDVDWITQADYATRKAAIAANGLPPQPLAGLEFASKEMIDAAKAKAVAGGGQQSHVHSQVTGPGLGGQTQTAQPPLNNGAGAARTTAAALRSSLE